MDLSPELYEHITASINVLGQDMPREADRRSPRLRLSSQLSIAMWSEPASPISVRVRDLSQGGIGLFHSERIALDERVLVRLPVKDDQTVAVLGTVVYWEPLAENLYGIGVQFDRVIDETEISQQSDGNTREQSHQIGMVARITQAFARTWRVAS
jgi:hypothetical protein